MMAAAKEAAGSASEYDGEDEEVDDECEIVSDEGEDEDGEFGNIADGRVIRLLPPAARLIETLHMYTRRQDERRATTVH